MVHQASARMAHAAHASSHAGRGRDRSRRGLERALASRSVVRLQRREVVVVLADPDAHLSHIHLHGFSIAFLCRLLPAVVLRGDQHQGS